MIGRKRGRDKRNYELHMQVVREYKICWAGQAPDSKSDGWIYLEPEVDGKSMNAEKCTEADCW